MSGSYYVGRFAALLWLTTLLSGTLLTLGNSDASAEMPMTILCRDALPGSEVDVGVDSEDRIVAAYRNVSTPALQVARVQCAGTLRETVYAVGIPGYRATLMVDSLGIPAIAHVTVENGIHSIRYTLAGGALYGNVTVTIPDTVNTVTPVLARDSVDRPYIACRQSDAAAALAQYDVRCGRWIVETIPGPKISGLNGRYVTVAIDNADRPVVAWYDTNKQIVIATRSDGAWAFRYHWVGDLTPGSSLCLAFDSVNAPLVACTSTAGLQLLRFNILNVTSESISSTANIRLAPHAMLVLPGNRVRIAYPDPPTFTLRVAGNDIGWQDTIVDTLADNHQGFACPSLAANSRGQWVAGYVDPEKRQIKLAGPALAVSAPGDFDCDGDVDSTDLDHLQSCTTAPMLPQTDLDCLNADLDRDEDVDQQDFGLFQRCLSGIGVPADYNCLD